jgi:transposase-like protein
VYRAVDQQGQVIDVYVSRYRDIAAARTFFTAALAVHGEPAEVVADREVRVLLDPDGRRALRAAAALARQSVTSDDVLAYRVTDVDVANLKRLLVVAERLGGSADSRRSPRRCAGAHQRRRRS